MNTFVQRHKALVTGQLDGWDRVRFRGTVRLLACASGLTAFLKHTGVLLKDFGGYAQEISGRLKNAASAAMEALGRPAEYVANSRTDKEALARRIALRDGVREGPVCVLTCVEPCMSFDVRRNRQSKRLELVSRWRKCLHRYHYVIHRQLGWLHVRVQTWLPFNVHVCINGREWLARRLEQEGIGFQRVDNTFLSIEDVPGAQRLMDEQLRTDWVGVLEGLRREACPGMDEVFAHFPLNYYWSADQSEWASDVMFRSSAALQQVYPRLVRHAMTAFGSPQVMRFLGRAVTAEQRVPTRFAGEVISDLRQRHDGVRIKHWIDTNALKMYDKQRQVLRVETTINHARDFRVFRALESQPRRSATWRPMRKGVADMHRRAQVSQAANQRYLQALAGVEQSTTLEQILTPLTRRRTFKGRPARALNPMALQDARLLEVVGRGEFMLNGLRNRDLQALLYTTPARDRREQARRSAAITRQLRLLRAHRIIRKVPRTHRYQVTQHGRHIITALAHGRSATLQSLAA